MRPEDCGLAFVDGDLRYIIDFEDLGNEVEVMLLDGNIKIIRSYFSTKKQRVIKAREAIYREPPRTSSSLSTNRQDDSLPGGSDDWHHLPGSEEEL